MKVLRIICMITVCAVLLSTAAAYAAGSYKRGDADRDGTVTIIDATAIQRTLASVPTVSFDEKAADVDGLGLSILDATAIQRFLAELENPFGIGEIVDEPPTEPTGPTMDEYELPFVPI